MIQVKSDGTESGTYNNVVSALSQIPGDGVVLMTGVNDEVVHGMYKAAPGPRSQNYLVNSFGGDPFGLAQVCADRTHYVGALFLQPENWGIVGAGGDPEPDQRPAVPQGDRDQGPGGNGRLAGDGGASK